MEGLPYNIHKNKFQVDSSTNYEEQNFVTFERKYRRRILIFEDKEYWKIHEERKLDYLPSLLCPTCFVIGEAPQNVLHKKSPWFLGLGELF